MALYTEFYLKGTAYKNINSQIARKLRDSSKEKILLKKLLFL